MMSVSMILFRRIPLIHRIFDPVIHANWHFSPKAGQIEIRKPERSPWQACGGVL